MKSNTNKQVRKKNENVKCKEEEEEGWQKKVKVEQDGSLSNRISSQKFKIEEDFQQNP